MTGLAPTTGRVDIVAGGGQGRRRRRRREWLVVAALGAVAVLLVGLSLAVGGYPITVPDLVHTLLGHGDTKDSFVVLSLRLPRATLGVLVGVAFGLAGGLLQTLLGNPLASPDIIGITGGASAAAVTAILVLGLNGLVVSGFALVGAVAVAALVSVLSRRSGLSGYRFVLIGIGIAFVVQAMVGYLLSRADVRDAQGALVWLVGSLSGARWQEIGILAGWLAVLLPAVAILTPGLRILELGEQAAAGLGVAVRRVRVAVLAAAVALAAVGTAAVGPVAFVSFVAAPIARRLVRTGSLALVPTALVGVVLVLGSDLIAQHALPGGIQVPAGAVMGVVGAPYLLCLLATAHRSRGVA